MWNLIKENGKRRSDGTEQEKEEMQFLISCEHCYLYFKKYKMIMISLQLLIWWVAMPIVSVSKDWELLLTKKEMRFLHYCGCCGKTKNKGKKGLLLLLSTDHGIAHSIWVWLSILHLVGRTDSPIQESIRMKHMRYDFISYRQFLIEYFVINPLTH